MWVEHFLTLQFRLVHSFTTLTANATLDELDVGLFYAPLSRIIPCAIKVEKMSGAEVIV